MKKKTFKYIVWDTNGDGIEGRETEAKALTLAAELAKMDNSEDISRVYVAKVLSITSVVHTHPATKTVLVK